MACGRLHGRVHWTLYPKLYPFKRYAVEIPEWLGWIPENSNTMFWLTVGLSVNVHVLIVSRLSARSPLIYCYAAQAPPPLLCLGCFRRAAVSRRTCDLSPLPFHPNTASAYCHHIGYINLGVAVLTPCRLANHLCKLPGEITSFSYLDL